MGDVFTRVSVVCYQVTVALQKVRQYLEHHICRSPGGVRDRGAIRRQSARHSGQGRKSAQSEFRVVLVAVCFCLISRVLEVFDEIRICMAQTSYEQFNF